MMETNFQMLKRLYREFKPENKGFLSGTEVEKIESYLYLNDRRDILDLRNLRDFTVMYFSQLKRDCDRASEKFDDLMDLVSGVTAVIDSHIFELGGEV